MKYCPLCDAEYAGSHERCTVCCVELVPEELRGRPLNEKERKDRIEVVWRGGDPLAVSEVIATLREAGIQHHVQATNDHMVFELGMPRPKYAVRVFSSDKEKARQRLADIRESVPFGLEAPESLQDGESVPEHVSIRWNSARATAEVWTGEDAALARLLEACFKENGIGVRREGQEPGRIRLVVLPAEEAAAREIVREVLEATPPA
jgi:hypothetical protein